MREHSQGRPVRLSDDEWDVIDEAARGLEELWQSSGGAELSRFLPPPDHPLRLRVLFELIKLDQEYRWRKGQQKKLEEYLLEWKELGDKPDMVRGLLIAECQTRAYLNLPATVDELRRRFPDIAEEIAPDKIAGEVAEECRTLTSGLRVHCPHCQNPIELVDDVVGEEIECPSCGSSFNLVRDDTGAAERRTSPRTIGRFELIEPLGKGAFGTVWRARDTELDCVRAVKLPRRSSLDPQDREKFLREARAAAPLRHPNIVSVHEVGIEADTLYIVSDLIEGLTLDQWLLERKPTDHETARLCIKIAEALDYAHEQGVVHRDLKPANVIIASNGEPHVMDFGLAKRDAGEITMTIEGQIIGTPAYMSPEQAAGSGHNADRRSDAYSLGVILFELLTGTPPFRGSVGMLLKQVIEDEPPSPRRLDSRIPRDLETICLKCLEKPPARRYPSTQAVADELRRYLRGRPIHARPVGRWVHAWRWCGRNPAIAVLGLFIAVLLLVLAIGGPLLAVRQTQLRVLAEENLYNARMALASRSWLEGDIRGVRRLLSLCPEHPRHWEWDYLRHLCHLDLLTIDNGDAAFSPDGRWIVSGNSGGDVAIWDAATGKALFSLDGCEGNVHRVSFSPDGRKILAGSEKRANNGKNTTLITVWDAKTGDRLVAIPGQTSRIRDVVFAPDGNRIVLKTDRNALKIWDIVSDKEVRTLVPFKPRIDRAYFSSDGGRLVANDAKGNVKILDIASGETIRTLAGNTLRNNDMYLSPDGRMLVSGVDDETTRVFDLQSGKELLVVEGRSSYVRDRSFSPDGRRIVLKNKGNQARIWNVSSGEVVQTIDGGNRRLGNVRFASGGRSVISSGGSEGGVRVWDAATGRECLTIDGSKMGIGRIACSSDGRRIVSGSPEGTVRIWDCATGNEVLSFKGHVDGIETVRFDANGRRILSKSLDGMTKLWDATTDRGVLVCAGHDAPIECLDFSPDSKWIVSGGGKTVQVSDLFTGEKTLVLKLPCPVACVSFNSDGRHIISACLDGTMIVWNASTGEKIRTFKKQENAVCRAAFSSDGRRIVSSDKKGTAVVRDVNTGEELCRIGGHDERLLCSAFSSDGARVVSGGADGTVIVWNAENARELLKLQGHKGRVNSVAFSSDGTRIVSGGSDKAVRVWDTATGGPVFVLEGHRRLVSSAVFSPDGRRIFSANGTDIVPINPWINRTMAKIWDAQSGQEVFTLAGPEEGILCVGCSPDQRHVALGCADGAVRVYSGIVDERLPRSQEDKSRRE